MRFMPGVTGRPTSLFLFLFFLVGVVALQSGCATRTVRSSFIDRFGIQVDFVRQVKGFSTTARDFEHPAIVSTSRLTHILGAIEIETPSKTGGAVRQPAFHPEIIEQTATALAEALAEVGPDQEVGVQILRREMIYGILNKKYLTSFLAYIDEGHLYLTLSRVEWFISKGFEEKRIPKPRRGERPMKFRVVSGEPLFYAGPQTLEIAWRDPAFKTAFQLPGSTEGATRRREVLFESPIPKAERDAVEASGDTLGVDELSPEQLRALADLEDDRQRGLITETTYQRARRQLLRRR